MQGKQVKQGKLVDSRIDLSLIERGIYILILTAGSKKLTQKFIIN
ncbi:MAG: T9SS type A sorting domain-containing protein [Bacteroidales bacterium]|nr:T9SS type A sorting domain-containing protein [Bacteroidales bacterium]